MAPKTLLAIALCLLGGCGRIGVDLLPLTLDPLDGCDGGDCEICLPLCTNAHGTTGCSAGTCEPRCAPGFADCDGLPANGCEAPLDPAGECFRCEGSDCGDAQVEDAGQVDDAGLEPLICTTGHADCDADPANGCEANIQSDPAHCGTCTSACLSGSELCSAGQCEPSPCPSGQGECDGDLARFCETNLLSSSSDCGFCGNVCSAANGSAACSAGSCVLSSCQSGFADCDARLGNGCETALDSVQNCGMCGRACTAASGGTAACSAGTCGTVCNLTGTYALKLSVAGSWPNDSYIQAGNGTFQFWMRLVVTQSGTSWTGTLTECGRSIPPFSARAVAETFLYAYPTRLFDADFLPAFPTRGTLGSTSPGASFALAPSAVQLGIDMALAPLARDPIAGAWPTAASQIPGANRLDMDRDGLPGVTAEYADSQMHPRTGGTLFDPRSDNPYVASRVAFSLSGVLDSCTQASGAANFSFIDTRIYACSLDSGECSATQANFLDQNCLNYTLGAGSYRLTKLSDGATCATVRSSLP